MTSVLHKMCDSYTKSAEYAKLFPRYLRRTMKEKDRFDEFLQHLTHATEMADGFLYCLKDTNIKSMRTLVIDGQGRDPEQKEIFPFYHLSVNNVNTDEIQKSAIFFSRLCSEVYNKMRRRENCPFAGFGSSIYFYKYYIKAY
ncbi:MAG: hypothetical protein MHMPM18_000517 [Marteilia pararefringens]